MPNGNAEVHAADVAGDLRALERRVNALEGHTTSPDQTEELVIPPDLLKEEATDFQFTIRRQIEIDAGHRVPYHDSQCRFLHGHRWKIVAHVSAPDLVPSSSGRPDSGMVVDFGFIKQVLMEQIHSRFDHRLMLWEKDELVTAWGDGGGMVHTLSIGDGVVAVPVIPTSEELARYWAELIAPQLSDNGFQLTALEVWETPNSVATYKVGS